MTNSGAVKLIDFGAAVDMCSGINFNPTAGMLDPRHGATPRTLVVPAPLALAALNCEGTARVSEPLAAGAGVLVPLQ